jgi:hypothetical protein
MKKLSAVVATILAFANCAHAADKSSCKATSYPAVSKGTPRALNEVCQKYLAPKIPQVPKDLIGGAKTRVRDRMHHSLCHPAQDLKMRRLYASGSASFQSTA